MSELVSAGLVTEEGVLAELARLAFADLEVSGLKPGEKLRALEMLARYLGLFRERREKPGESCMSFQWAQE